MVNLPLGRLLQVEVVRLEAMQDPPFVILKPSHSNLFEIAQTEGILDMQRPMILDPLFQDFSSRRIEQALRAVGGNPPPMRRRRRRG